MAQDTLSYWWFSGTGHILLVVQWHRTHYPIGGSVAQGTILLVVQWHRTHYPIGGSVAQDTLSYWWFSGTGHILLVVQWHRTHYPIGGSVVQEHYPIAEEVGLIWNSPYPDSDTVGLHVYISATVRDRASLPLESER